MAKKILFPFLVASMALCACDFNLVDVVTKESEDKFKIDLISKMSLSIGETSNLVLDIQPDEGAEIDTSKLAVKWVNSNAQAVSIGESKTTETLVTGLSTGEAVITALVGDTATASCRVSVSNTVSVEVLSLNLSEHEKTYTYNSSISNNSFGLVAQVETNPRVSNINVTWKSTEPSVATVTSRGINATVNVLSAGETDIVASFGRYSDRCKLSVSETGEVTVLGVSLDVTSKTMEVEDTLQLRATTSGNVVSTRWQSSDPAVATVSQTGLVQAKASGDAVISVTVSDGDATKSATCKVHVDKKGSSSDYDDVIASKVGLTKPGHIYFHYLRTSNPANYDNWALWIWQSFPKNLEGSLWGANASKFSADTPIKPANIQSLGFMTLGQVEGTSSTTVYSDDYGQIIDVDLKAAFIKGGKTGLESPLISDWDQTIVDKTDIGFLIVDQTKMTGETMWTSDGSGETFLKKLGKKYGFASDKYLHVYCVEGNVSNFTTTSGKQVVNNPTLDDETGNYRSIDDQTLLTKDEYSSGISTSTTFKNDRPGVGYQIFVPSFADSDGDGFGDIRGIINKLDYIKNDVGAEVLWLTPIQESNSYHGYDVTDYYKIDSRFGTLEDYQELIYKAHKKGMKVLMDMVINHTSKSNVLFKKSEAAVTEYINGKEINYRDMYLWKYKTDKVMVWDYASYKDLTPAQKKDYKATLSDYKEVEVSDPACDNQWFKDGTSNYYYFGKFGSGMAELNYNCQATRDYMTDMCKYWLSFGLDGFRLDAIKHIYLLGELNPNLRSTISGHSVTFDAGEKHYWNEEMGKYDDVANDYSYDRDMNVLFWKQFSGNIKASYPNCFLVGENFDGWNERMAPFYEAIDSQFDFSTYYHLNELKEESIGYDVATSLGEYAKYRGDLINGAYTSNHDVARMLNHAAAHDDSINSKYGGGDGIHHKEISTGSGSNADYAKNMARYYAAMTILTPGVSWIYYGDEIGMSGNVQDEVADSHGNVYNDHGNNVDRWYRQPMRWGATKGSDSVVDYTFGGIEVLWDKYNQNLAPVPTQKSDANSMLNFFKAVCAVKNDDAYPTYGFISGAGTFSGDQTVKFDVSDGTRTVAVFINNSDSAKGFSMQGYSLLGSSVGGTGNSCPAHGFVVMKKN